MSQDLLETRCPACQTTFEVDSETLKLARGRVRCGDCLQIFDALANAHSEIPILRRPDMTSDDVATPVDPTVPTAPSDDLFAQALATDAPGETSVDFELSEPTKGQAADGALDFDLGVETPAPDSAGDARPATEADTDGLDFDLGSGAASGASASALAFDAPTLSGGAAKTDIDFDIGADMADSDNESSSEAGSPGELDIDLSTPGPVSKSPFATSTGDMHTDDLDASADAAIDAGQWKQTGDDGADTDIGSRSDSFLFNDDTPDELLDAELGISVEQAAEDRDDSAEPDRPVIAEDDYPGSATVSGDDWGDLLSEIDEDNATGFSFADGTHAGIDPIDKDVPDPLLADADDDIAREKPDALTLADEPVQTPQAGTREEVAVSIADDAPPSTMDPDSGEVDGADDAELTKLMPSAEVDGADLTKLITSGEGDTPDDADLTTLITSEEGDTPDDADLTKLMSSGDGDGADVADLTTLITSGEGDTPDDADLTKLMSSEEGDGADDALEINEDVFDSHAVSDILAASTVFLTEPDGDGDSVGDGERSPSDSEIGEPSMDAEPGLISEFAADNEAAADPDLPQQDNSDTDEDTGDARPDSEVSEKQDTAQTESADAVNTALANAPVIEEIILESDTPDSDTQDASQEDLFAESMILMAQREKPARRTLWTSLSLLLLLALAVQAIHLFRGQIATYTPWGDYLVAAYEKLGLSLEPRWNVNRLCIERSGSALTPEAIEFETLFRNQSSRAMPLPLIKIDITDSVDKVIATAVLEPSEYVPSESLSADPVIAAGARMTAAALLDYTESRADRFELSLCYSDDGRQLRCGAAICGSQ